jgi:hypothetical protein
LGIIENPNPTNCSYTIDDLNTSILEQQFELALNQQSSDNCPFSQNVDQIDLDLD